MSISTYTVLLTSLSPLTDSIAILEQTTDYNRASKVWLSALFNPPSELKKLEPYKVTIREKVKG